MASVIVLRRNAERDRSTFNTRAGRADLQDKNIFPAFGKHSGAVDDSAARLVFRQASVVGLRVCFGDRSAGDGGPGRVLRDGASASGAVFQGLGAAGRRAPD